MSEWTPVVIKLENIERHPNADSLETCTVLGGYTVIFKEGQYKNGDLASYIPVDSICSDLPEFDWLGTKKRIKAVRLRGIFSMGITAPAPPGMNEGDSIVEHYGLKKFEYDEEKPEAFTENEHGPSGWTLPKYDLDALRKYGRMLVEGEDVVIAEKLEGCNAAFVWDGERLWCKSHFSFKKEEDTNQWWAAAKRNGLAEKLKPYPMMAFLAELYGQVKGFKYDAPLDAGKRIEPQLRFFDVLDIKAMKYLDWDDAAKMIGAAGLKTAPEIYRGPWKGQEMWALADGTSLIGDHIREGFVVRPLNERVDPRHGRTIYKHKGETYLLKKK